jgi:glycosyltransferase involved in cell wall biosynthesis
MEPDLMVPSQPHIPVAAPTPGAGRRFAFLVSTTPCVRVIRDNLGSSAYSYSFVLDALAPVLERLGTWRLLDRPESQLPHLAAKAVAEGLRPVHLALNPLQDVYLSPALPNILFPFWEFPDLPDRSFGFDTRQDWTRAARHASLVLAACEFTADAFRRAEVGCPVAVVPVPLDPAFFELPPWDPAHAIRLTCRHEIWGGEAVDDAPAQTNEAPTNERRRSYRRRAWDLARAGFRRIEPRLDPELVGRLTRLRHRVATHAGKSPAKVAYLAARAGYRKAIRPWLSTEALERITAFKARLLTLAGRSPQAVVDPLLPSGRLTLSGLVYTSFFNVGDLRKNYRDLLSASLLAFRDRPDVTLVLKLATSPHREHNEVGVLRREYEALGLSHRCRVVVVTEYLDGPQMAALFRATTFYVNTSHAEGACLPLQRALAGGRPAIAPDHTAMADYMDAAVGFVPRSHPEPTHWPHDPERRMETWRHRLVWSDIEAMLRESAEVAERDRPRYEAMASAARRRMTGYASRTVATEALRRALELLPEAPVGAIGWGNLASA